MEYVLLILGLIAIVKASDVVVNAASSLATRLRVPKMIIALTIMAFGTCIPELAISFQSIRVGNGAMALANVIGSCIVNVFLIIGLAALVRPIRIQKVTIRKELPILLIITAALMVLVMDKLYLSKYLGSALNRDDGIILLMIFGIFVVYIINVVRKNRDYSAPDIIKYTTFRSILYLVLAIAVITIASDVVVDNAVLIAGNLGISEKIITLVVIVIGTSLPEMVMTVTSARKNEFELAVGNIIGTNIFNIGVVLGLPIAVFGKLQIVEFNLIDLIFLLLSSIIFFQFSKSDRKITRVEGIAMLLIFALYYVYAILY